jgi:NADPH:quinone reductase-like Zn-dependent oxidoreductase
VHAAVLHEHGTAPRFGEFDEPSAAPGEVVVEVAAAAIHHLDLHKATGTFYTGPPPLPSVVGTDGVGRLVDGRRVYFDATISPYGSMAQRALATEDALFELPEGSTCSAATSSSTSSASRSRRSRRRGSARAVHAGERNW